MKDRSMSFRNKILNICVLTSLAMGGFSSVAFSADTSGKLSLRDAIAKGVWTNPEYGVVATNRVATEAELRQAKGLFLPSVDVQGDIGQEYTDNPNTRGGLDSDDTETLLRRQAGVTLTQMLFDGWDSWNEVQRQRHRTISAANRVWEASELAGLSVVESYLEVLRQRELLKIARENVAQHLDILAQIDDSAQAGRTTAADAEQARARVASARAQEANIREALRIAEASYIRYVGESPKDLVVPSVPANVLEASVEEEVRTALAQSPTLSIFEADIDVAQSEYKKSNSAYYPELNLQMNAREANDTGGVEGRDTSASALVRMNWNLYRGGIDTARVNEFANRFAQTKERRAQAARSVENDVRQTWARMVAAGERAQQFSVQADANVEIVKAYLDQFDLNRRTLLDVLDSQNELFVSRSNVVNSEFLEMLAIFRLLSLKGRLFPTMNIEYPPETQIEKIKASKFF